MSSFSARRIFPIIALLLLVALGVGYYAWKEKDDARAKKDSDMMKSLGFGMPAVTELASDYSDADGDLVADVPADATKHLSPDTLVFSYIASSNQERQKKVWGDILTELGEAIGKTVELEFHNNEEAQLAALKEGKLHVTAFNTGGVTKAVCTAGFIPCFTYGNEDGEFGYRMKIIVPSKSAIQGAADIKGSKITFTRPTSNSGCKAAMVFLSAKHQLHPERDYEFNFSMSHDHSIDSIKLGDSNAVAIAGNLLDRAIQEGRIKEEDFRTIHESERFPPAAIGLNHALAPELAEKIRTFFAEYNFAGKPLGEDLAGSGETKFVPVNYNEHWAIIRTINEELAKGE